MTDDASRRLLIGPAILAGAGFALFVTVPTLGDLLDLSPDGAAVLFLHHASGVWMFLALAWLATRCCDLLLRRVAVISPDPVRPPASCRI